MGQEWIFCLSVHPGSFSVFIKSYCSLCAFLYRYGSRLSLHPLHSYFQCNLFAKKMKKHTSILFSHRTFFLITTITWRNLISRQTYSGTSMAVYTLCLAHSGFAGSVGTLWPTKMEIGGKTKEDEWGHWKRGAPQEMQQQGRDSGRKGETVKGLLFGSATANTDETEVFLARSRGSLDTWHGNPQVPASVAIN